MRIVFEVEADLEEHQVLQYHEIIKALVTSGGGTGVKNGRTILHFSKDGVFMGVELDYWPWRRRSAPDLP